MEYHHYRGEPLKQILDELTQCSEEFACKHQSYQLVFHQYQDVSNHELLLEQYLTLGELRKEQDELQQPA